MVVNLNAPISRPSAFGPENRGSAVLQLVTGQVLGTSTDKVTFQNAADAPGRITVTGTGGSQQINMAPPWIVGTDVANATTFLDIDNTSASATTTGFVPVTYVALPATGGTGTEITNSTGTTLTGNVTVAAARVNANMGGNAFTLNLTSGGLMFTSAAAGFTISPAVNFGSAEGVISNISGQANTISGKISGTGGLTKFGANSVLLSNAANDFTGGVTIDEANLRPGAASTATASPFGFSGGAFNVVTVNTAGVLDLNGVATTIGGLQGTGHVNDQSATAATLTLNVVAANTGANALTFAGTIGGNSVTTTNNGPSASPRPGRAARS